MYSKDRQGVLVQFSLAENSFKLDTVPKNKELENKLMRVDTSKAVHKIRNRRLFIKLVDREMSREGFKRVNSKPLTGDKSGI
jgi:hypothetical protein